MKLFVMFCLLSKRVFDERFLWPVQAVKCWGFMDADVKQTLRPFEMARISSENVNNLFVWGRRKTQINLLEVALLQDSTSCIPPPPTAPLA